jgi:hypothetical protein
MGCNGSKQEDIARDRKRTVDVPSRSRPIGVAGGAGEGKSIGIRGNQEGYDMVYPGSMTNKNLREHEFLDHLVKHTSHNFIDITSEAVPLDVAAIRHRRQRYAQLFANVLVAPGHAGAAMPAAGQPVGAEELANRIEAALASSKPQLEDVQRIAEQLEEALHKDLGAMRASGRLVLSFDELQTEFEDKKDAPATPS